MSLNYESVSDLSRACPHCAGDAADILSAMLLLSHRRVTTFRGRGTQLLERLLREEVDRLRAWHLSGHGLTGRGLPSLRLPMLVSRDPSEDDAEVASHLPC